MTCPKPPRMSASAQALVDQARRACPPEELDWFDREVAGRAQHAAASRTANVNGDSWQAWCEAQHRWAKEHRIAEVDHYDAAGTPHIVGGKQAFDRRGRMLKAMSGKSPPDYVGHTLSGPPRAVYVEAKWRGENRLSREEERPGTREKDRHGLPKHQREKLESAGRAGHIALVVVGFQRANGPCHYAVPWLELETLWTAKGAVRSVGPTELRGHECVPGCYLLRWIRGGA